MLRPPGYARLAELDGINSGSKQAFVAMWFDESMKSAYEDGIEPAIRQAGYEPTRRDEVEFDDWSERYANTWKMGIQAFEYLEGTIGLDIDRVFDRWNQVPSIFVPKHVSDRHGLTEKGSLYELLNDAIRAFVTGAPAASNAMCRAALEMVLRDYYVRGSSDDNSNLHDVIDLAVLRYDFLSAKKLHSLRMDANRILHAYNSAAPLSEEDERKLLSFLKDLKFYIERAPER